MSYNLLDHKTDLKIKVKAKTKEKLFQDACLAMSEAILPQKLGQYPEQEEVEVTVKAKTLEDLLVNFLNEVLYLGDVNNLSYRAKEFPNFSDKKLKAKLIGYSVPADQFTTEVKAATYHGLEIKKKDNRFETTIIFDI